MPEPSLQDLLARGVAVEWFEAVAIVQALCKRLLDEAPTTSIRVPDLHEIVLADDGTVVVTGDGPAGQAPVFRLGRVLTALVADEQMPVALRLLALRAVSPSPPYNSVQDLTTALDYFERPDRGAIVRVVYERYQQVPAAANSAAVIEEIPAAPARARTVAVRSWWTRHPAVLVTGLLLLGAAAAGAFVTFRSRVPWVAAGSSQVVQLAGATTDAVAKTVSSGIEALRVRLGGTSAPDAKVELPPLVPAPPPTLPRPTRTLLPATGSWMKSGGTPVSAPPVGPAAALDGVVDPTSLLEPPPLPAPVVEPRDWTIYSTADLDVVPPVTIHPRLPSDPPPGVNVESLPLVELVVSASGEVESVRLKTPSPDIRTSMMISAIKAWRFQPATRNGRPVRYRSLIRLTRQ